MIELTNPEELSLAEVNGKYLDKLIKTKVMISKSSQINKEIYGNEWTCANCGDKFEEPLFSILEFCPNCKTRKLFKKELKRDFKEIEVEEILENLTRQPERLRARIVGRLLFTKKVETLQPGDIVELVAYVKEERVKSKLDRIILNYYLLIDEFNKSDIGQEDENINEEDLNQIKELSKNNPIDKLRDSLAPNIYDYDKIKTALLLQMVRGPESMENVRPTIHILLCGSASVAKSKLAENVHSKSPKSIYGSGENMSKAGLVATMEKDDLSGRWSIRAGTICRANKSLVIIDELDKLSKEDRDGLHTPMEMGKVLVDKAGIHASMNADTSILGCCNPKNGRFDLTHMDSIQSQINLPEPLMSRFDLIWIMQDFIDKEKDEKILRSLMSTKKKSGLVSDKLFKKYIKYASSLCPVINEEVQETLIEIVSNLRQRYKVMQDKSGKGTITFRQAGGLIRLSIASAKLRLSDKVELRDLKLAEELMLDALESAGFSRDFNQLEYAALYGGTTKKKMDLNERLKEEIRVLLSKGISTEEGIEKDLVLKYSEKDVSRLMNQLRQEGTLVGKFDNLKWIS